MSQPYRNSGGQRPPDSFTVGVKWVAGGWLLDKEVATYNTVRFRCLGIRQRGRWRLDLAEALDPMPQAGNRKQNIAGLRLKLKAAVQEAVEELYPGYVLAAMQRDRIVMTEEGP